MTRIALIGNMNNNFFSIQRLLRRAGYDADLFRFSDEPEHFDPGMDTYSDSWRMHAPPFPPDADPTSAAFLAAWRYRFRVRVRKLLEPYDLLIGCGIAPSVVERIGRRLHVFIPYGSDFYEVPFGNDHGPVYESLVALAEVLWPVGAAVDWACQRGLLDSHKYYGVLVRRLQRKGVRNSRHIFFFGAPADFKALETELGVRDRCHEVAIPAVVSDYYASPDDAKRSSHYAVFERVRADSDFVLFHHSRHAWHDPPNRWTRKNNDMLLNGFADFLRRAPASVRKPMLVTLEYGPDVDASKRLIESLGIGEHVQWLPQMSRRDLMAGLMMADIGVVEFGHTWLTGGTLFEFLSQGVPVMQRFDEAELEGDHPEPYPMIVANTTDEIADRLLQYSTDRDGLRRIGQAGKAWYQRHVIDRFMDKLRELTPELQ